VFDVVGGEHRIHGSIGHRSHVGHGADQIGLHLGVDIEADLLPTQTRERSLVGTFRAAAHMQKGAGGKGLNQFTSRSSYG